MKVAIPALVALVGFSFVAGCQRPHLPQSPIAAILSESEAVELAEDYLDESDAPARTLTRIQPTGEGYLLSYESSFDVALRPPKEARLVVVQHDGTVRPLTFTEDR